MVARTLLTRGRKWTTRFGRKRRSSAPPPASRRRRGVFTFTHNLAPGAARAQLEAGERTAAPAWQGQNTRFQYMHCGFVSFLPNQAFPRSRPPRLEFLPKFAAAPFSLLALALAAAHCARVHTTCRSTRYCGPASGSSRSATLTGGGRHQYLAQPRGSAGPLHFGTCHCHQSSQSD